MDFDQTTLRSQIENEIATLLVSKLEKEEITPQRASDLAKFVILTIPASLNDQQLMTIVPSLDDEFYELASVVNKHIREYEEKYQTQVEMKVKELIDAGHFQEASKIMNLYFQKKYAGI